MTTQNSLPFNKKTFRGARILRYKRDLEVMIEAHKKQLIWWEEKKDLYSEKEIEFLKGRIEGLRQAKSAMIKEFQDIPTPEWD